MVATIASRASNQRWVQQSRLALAARRFLQCCQFSSTPPRPDNGGRDTGSDGSGGKKESKRSGPILIKDTKRGTVSAKLRPAAPGGTNSQSPNQPPAPGISANGIATNGHHSGESSSTNSNPFFDSERFLPQGQPRQHPAHHYINGGIPCDPAPPPFRLAEYGEESLHTLVLLRHGESEWNSQNRYTGWCDVNLTDKGQQEARTAGRLLFENGVELDHAFTSVLKRASFSCNMALNAAQQHWVPVTKTWRLNERHYGALQGYNKETAWQELGLDQELVMQMRRAYDVQPPRMDDSHPYWHGKDRRYRNLSDAQLELSRTESLKDCAERIMPFFNSVIAPSIRAGNKTLIVSHANTIRTLIKQIDNISDEDIKGMTIPTGVPLLYRLDKNLNPVDPQIELEFQYMVEPRGYTWGTSRAHGFHGVYLGDLERLQDIQRKRDATNRDWQRIILRNIGKSFGWDMESSSLAEPGSSSSISQPFMGNRGLRVIETRQLWWQVHTKLSLPDYSNMLLLVKMEEALEELMYQRKQQYITKRKYEKMVNKLHLDTEGKVVEPFSALADRHDREERHRIWYESLALDLEEECLIK